ASSSRTYSKVDTLIFRCLWQWARRRHPRKGAHWVKKKYFTRVGQVDCVFFGEAPGKKGESKQKVYLLKAGQTKIKRHVKVRGDANPYAPENELYFEERRQQRMEATLTKGSVPWRLWKGQKGKCPRCQ